MVTKMNKMNKKGKAETTIFGINMVWAIFLAMVLLIFLVGGGVSTILNITKVLKSIPSFLWVILGIVFLFKLLGGKK